MIDYTVIPNAMITYGFMATLATLELISHEHFTNEFLYCTNFKYI